MVAAAIGTLGRRLNESIHSKRLLRMLRSMLQSYPKAKILRRKAGFGVSLDENTYLYVSFSGNLTDEAKRDCLGLFITWLVVDPEGLEKAPTLLDG